MKLLTWPVATIAALSLWSSGLGVGLAFNPEHLQQLRQTKKCPGCDLSYARLTRMNLAGADLKGANLNAADLRYANLRQTNLTGANLNLADLRWANLSGANASAATLLLTRLDNAVLDQVNLLRAILGGRDRLAAVESYRGATLPNGNPAFFP
uniref:Pentapeptide repeat protein n=1 Tax=Cyanothece sp. (strain PCC 7425 / ATCC 29141) TaxID=395961 RepID=B8HYL4_CYAP4